MRFRFIHTADLHLDAPFRGIARLDPELSRRLRDASLDALDRIVDKAIESEVAFVLFAGDLYDGVEHGIRAQIRFSDALRRLSERGIRAFVVHGNHDPEGGRWNAIHSWPEGVTIFHSGTVQSETVTRGGHALATVHGISFGQREERDNLSLRFPDARGPGLNIALMHGNVAGQTGHDPYAPCTLDDLRAKPMDYWALGHVHRNLVLHRRPWVVYPGNTHGRGLKANERGMKGALLVEVEDGRVQEPEHFPTDSVRFEECALDLASVEDIPSVVERLRTDALALSERAAGADILLRARLTGRTPLFRELRAAEAREDLLSQLNQLSPAGAHWLSLDFQAGPELDLEAIRASNDLRASLLETSGQWERAETALPPELLNRLRAVYRSEKQDTELEVMVREVVEDAAYELLERLTPANEERT